jgi:hypothetical protein
VEDRIGELPDGKDGVHALPEQWDGSVLAPITWGHEQVKKNWKKIFGGVPDITAEVVRFTADGDTAWSEWKMGGTRRDRSPFRMRGVAIYGVADDQAAWCRFYLEPVDEEGEDINAATRRVATGALARAERTKGSR